VTARLASPAAADATAPAHKDWLHLNVLDQASGIVGVVNVSIHGSPMDLRSRVVGAALIHVPGAGWAGNAEVADIEAASLGISSVGLEHLGVAVDERQREVLASVRLPDDGLALDLRASWDGPLIDALGLLRFEEGWVGWRLAPRVSIEGDAHIGASTVPLDHASGYFDHTYGRWHWGADFRWDWGAFVAPAPGPAIVFSRGTDHARRNLGPPLVFVDDGSSRRRFVGPAVEMRMQGRLNGPLIRRVPGAIAALHADRAAPPLPERIVVVADDGIDRVEVTFLPQGAMQLLAADPFRAGCAFIHELAGTFDATLRMDGAVTHASGPAIFELVE
jgi:hypothetical protein